MKNKNFKTILLAFAIILFIFLQFSCGPCNNQCLNGQRDENCDCKCADGWIGVSCDQKSGTNLISAEINYPGYFKYNTIDLEVKAKTYSASEDTLYIDSETTFGEWIYIKLIVDDLSKISKMKFPITHGGLKNEAWFRHLNPTVTTNVFSPVTSKPIAGYFEVDTINISPLLLKAKFSTSLFAPVSDTCFVKNGIIEYAE